jgi:hypothetical protein
MGEMTELPLQNTHKGEAEAHRLIASAPVMLILGFDSFAESRVHGRQ